MLPPLEMTGGVMVSYIGYTVFNDVSLSVCRHLKNQPSILRLCCEKQHAIGYLHIEEIGKYVLP